MRIYEAENITANTPPEEVASYLKYNWQRYKNYEEAEYLEEISQRENIMHIINTILDRSLELCIYRHIEFTGDGEILPAVSTEEFITSTQNTIDSL